MGLITMYTDHINSCSSNRKQFIILYWEMSSSRWLFQEALYGTSTSKCNIALMTLAVQYTDGQSFFIRGSMDRPYPENIR